MREELGRGEGGGIGGRGGWGGGGGRLETTSEKLMATCRGGRQAMADTLLLPTPTPTPTQ